MMREMPRFNMWERIVMSIGALLMLGVFIYACAQLMPKDKPESDFLEELVDEKANPQEMHK